MNRDDKLTASNLVKALRGLPSKTWFEYPNPSTKTKVRVASVQGPEGPVVIESYNPHKKGEPKAKTLSSNMLWRVAQAMQVGVPINFDRVLGASYNTRSALEALLAHTPEFYLCYPGRIESNSSSNQVKKGHKHLIWKPSDPHQPGRIAIADVDVIISEIPSSSNVYEAIEISTDFSSSSPIDIEIKRRHVQIQLALVAIGRQLGFRTYVAKNDQGILYQGKRIGSLDGVVSELSEETLVTAHQEAVEEGRLIDCVWFRNSKFMPAVMEVEHSTGITSGLTRMKNFKSYLPEFPTRWTIVAPDEDRSKVMEKCSKPQFRELNAKFFPYSAVEELYSLCERRRLAGVNDDFLDCFMEPTSN
jgi:type II restriction enzyme